MEGTAVTGRLVAKIVLVAAGTLGGIYLLYLLRNVIGLILIGAFFALAIAPGVNWLHNRNVPRWIAILLVYISIAGGIFGIGLLIVPPLVSGVDKLSNDLPGYVDDLRNNDTFRRYDNRYGITEKLREQAKNLPSKLGEAAGTLRDVTVGAFSRLIELLSILVIAFFLLIDGQRILAFFYRQLPKEREQRLRGVAEDISDAIGGYVFGNLVISLLAGTVTYITLTILGVPFAIALAVTYAFFDLIPFIGATIGGIVVGIVVAFVDFPTALIVWAAVIIAYQLVENHMIQPVVYAKTVRLHPLAVIVAVLVGAALLGILGVLIAIPTAAALQSVARDWWQYRQGEPQPAEAAAPS